MLYSNCTGLRQHVGNFQPERSYSGVVSHKMKTTASTKRVEGTEQTYLLHIAGYSCKGGLDFLVACHSDVPRNAPS